MCGYLVRLEVQPKPTVIPVCQLARNVLVLLQGAQTRLSAHCSPSYQKVFNLDGIILV